jgi:hypothetical protein
MQFAIKSLCKKQIAYLLAYLLDFTNSKCRRSGINSGNQPIDRGGSHRLAQTRRAGNLRAVPKETLMIRLVAKVRLIAGSPLSRRERRAAASV